MHDSDTVRTPAQARSQRQKWKLCATTRRAYCVGVSNAISEDLIDKFAPADVRDTVRWLKDHRFVMAGSDPDRGTFGSRWVFAREATEVHVTVDRSQWVLDIVPHRGGHPIQYDLLVAAQRGQDYRNCFPQNGDEHQAGLDSQLPPGVSWHHTLPQVLTWLNSDAYDAAAVERARDQRYVRMWPDSPKARRLLRSWGEDRP
jgi:hypothetical protein